MKKTFIYALLGFLAVTALNGCLPKDHNVYDGPNLVEFKNQTLGINSAVLATRGIATSPATQVQTDVSRTILINTRVVDTVYVQLIGPQQSAATVVNFSPTAGNTAVEGTNYNFRPAGARNLTIPANSSVGYLLVDVIANSIATVGDTRTLSIDLLGASNISPSPNYKKFNILLRR
jgi:hypothetical protein